MVPLHNPANGAINGNIKHVANNMDNGSINISQFSALDNNDSTDSRAENAREADKLVANQIIGAPPEITDDELIGCQSTHGKANLD